MPRKRLIERITSAADLIAEPLPGRPLVEISGERSVLVENHHGVSEYSREMIGVNVKFGKICVHGSQLELQQMTKERLIISGRIDRVELQRGKLG